MSKHQITNKCTSCHACGQVCPTESIFYGHGQYVIDLDTCTGCKVCVPVCPVKAIIPAGGEEGSSSGTSYEEEEN